MITHRETDSNKRNYWNLLILSRSERRIIHETNCLFTLTTFEEILYNSDRIIFARSRTFWRCVYRDLFAIEASQLLTLKSAKKL